MGDGLLSRHASTSSTVADLYMFVNCETGTPISFKADIFTKMTCNRGLPCSCIMKDNVMRNVKDGSIQLPRSVKRRQRSERSILPHPVPSLHRGVPNLRITGKLECECFGARQKHVVSNLSCKLLTPLQMRH